MNTITVSREYGAGGAEVARHLAERLGWELLDRELLQQAAHVERLDAAELDRLDEKPITLVERFRLYPKHQHYLEGLRKVARQAAEKGRMILVGRGTHQLLADIPGVFHLRLMAPREWRARRMAQIEGWPLQTALVRCTQEDHHREQFTRYFFGEQALEPTAYHAVFNTGWVPLNHVVDCVAAVVSGTAEEPHREPGKSAVLTLARELGAGETTFARALAPRLGLTICDRELLEQEAARLGVPVTRLEKIDEQPDSLFERICPGSLHQSYFDALQKIMKERAAQGNVLLVGRGGSRFLRDWPNAFHVRLVAPLEDRVRRVMEHRWQREDRARQLIAESDSSRRQFYQSYFGANWADPLEYHLTVNTARLGAAALDLVARAASLYWKRHDA